MTYLTSLKKYLHAKGSRLLGLSLLVVAGCSNPSPSPGSQFKGELELLVGDKGEFKLVNKGPGKVNLGQYTLSFRVAEAKDYDNNDVLGLKAYHRSSVLYTKIQDTQTGNPSEAYKERTIEIREKGIKSRPWDESERSEKGVVLEPEQALIFEVQADVYGAARVIIECSLLDPAGKQIAQKRGNVWESRVRVCVERVADGSSNYNLSFSIENTADTPLDLRVLPGNPFIYQNRDPYYGEERQVHVECDFFSRLGYSKSEKISLKPKITTHNLSPRLPILQKSEATSFSFRPYTLSREEITHVAIVVKNERFEVIGASEKKALLP